VEGAGLFSTAIPDYDNEFDNTMAEPSLLGYLFLNMYVT